MSLTKFNWLVDELWKIRTKLNDKSFYFDFPDYGNIPISLSNRLSPEAVDAIQSVFHPNNNYALIDKKTFSRELKMSMIGLRERIR